MKRVFVANRGEIAVRILRACREMGLETVLAASSADRDTLGAELADRTVVIGPPPARDSYLNLPVLVHAALATGCDALHPGYGFLSERAELAELCETSGLAFVGPRAETMRRLGDKLSARAVAEEIGVPTVPGTGGVADVAQAAEAAARIGFPVVLKASAGGGGRGMFLARDAATIARSFDTSSEEARSAFGDGTLYIERYVENARHVEVQILGDGNGKAVHFGERDCSAQRRYQKVVEEAPCAVLPPEVRVRLHEAALRLARHVSYRNAGTVEFLYDVDREAFYFIEVNARIQVEHPVTEMVTGADLVQWQLRLAAGEPLALEQSDILTSGHAVECRINAEDAARDFRPSPGRIATWDPPHGPGIRLDSHCRAGYLVPPFYDSLLGKLIVRGRDRPEAVALLRGALEGFGLEGITTNLPFLRALAGHPDFVANAISTKWLEKTLVPSFVS